MEKLFKLKAHGTDVKTEIRAGITTFFAMAYIIFVNSNYLSMTGMNKTGVMVATCISAAIGCLLTAFLANVPFCQAPGMGLNTFFTFTVCFGMGYTWEQALAIVFISGLLFLVVTVSPLRKKIIEAIPASLKAAISAGIGFFIALIGTSTLLPPSVPAKPAPTPIWAASPRARLCWPSSVWRSPLFWLPTA